MSILEALLLQGAVSRENVRLAVALTGGLPDDSLPEVETFQGRLSADIIKKVKLFWLPDSGPLPKRKTARQFCV